MRTIKLWRLAFAMLSAFSLASCSSDEPDGKWDSMVWKAEVPVQITDRVYNVSETGAELVFSCKNYSSPWISDAESRGEHYFPSHEVNDYHTVSADWFKAEINGNKLTVVFNSNATTEERPLQLTVTAGDIFYTFSFKQNSAGVLGYCQIRYSFFGASQDLLDFYDITAEYLDISGQQQTKVIEGNQWLYEPESLSISDAPEEFKCRIVAKRETNLPELTDDTYEIGYGISSQVVFLNAKGDEINRVKHTQPSSFTFETDRTGMLAFLNSTSEIEIENFSFKCDKSDIIERLK